MCTKYRNYYKGRKLGFQMSALELWGLTGLVNPLAWVYFWFFGAFLWWALSWIWKYWNFLLRNDLLFSDLRSLSGVCQDWLQIPAVKCRCQNISYQIIENAVEKWFRYRSRPVRILWNSSGASRLLWSEERTWNVIILWTVYGLIRTACLRVLKYSGF